VTDGGRGHAGTGLADLVTGHEHMRYGREWVHISALTGDGFAILYICFQDRQLRFCRLRQVWLMHVALGRVASHVEEQGLSKNILISS
jgi:hypothetical protein